MVKREFAKIKNFEILKIIKICSFADALSKRFSNFILMNLKHALT